ncbi:MAG: FtsQ-type POTRA domain-containing protein [Treponema sp.]|jgi:cell division protein FtsQ|nr:FtsQ-type POTRA domain-containing protein [Treponema sp.]
MSDYSLLADDESEFIDKEQFLKENSEKKTDKKIIVVKIVFFILCFILLAEFVAYKYVVPLFESPKINVTGQKNYTMAQIGNRLAQMDTSSWLKFDVNKAVALLSSEPEFESVSVQKKFPNIINISLQERDPVAMTFIAYGGKSTLVQIDKNGVIFPKKTNVKYDTSDIPIISGLPIENMSEGMRIPSKYRSLLEEVNSIRQLPQKYFVCVDEICVLPKEYGNYELALIPSQSKIRVLTDRTLNEDSLKCMMVVLDVINRIDKDVSEVDLRYGSVSYRVK